MYALLKRLKRFYHLKLTRFTLFPQKKFHNTGLEFKGENQRCTCEKVANAAKTLAFTGYFLHLRCRRTLQTIVRKLFNTASFLVFLMNILLLDNYDSFTYNLAHYIREICGIDSHPNNHTLDVIRNDKIALADVEKYDKIVLSPGPGIPQEAGIMPELIKQYAPTKSIFGVCLGHQAIGEAFGGTLTNLSRVIHGFATSASICAEDILFRNVPNTLNVGRYHSWVIANEHFPEELEITARDNDGFIMALRHKRYDVRGVQFHPESVLTEHGKTMVQNWLQN